MTELALDFNSEESELFFWVLANKTRRKVLNLLQLESPLNISTIAKKLQQTEANISYQVQFLEKAGLIKVDIKCGRHGLLKNIAYKYSTIQIKFNNQTKEAKTDG